MTNKCSPDNTFVKTEIPKVEWERFKRNCPRRTAAFVIRELIRAWNEEKEREAAEAKDENRP